MLRFYWKLKKIEKNKQTQSRQRSTTPLQKRDWRVHRTWDSNTAPRQTEEIHKENTSTKTFYFDILLVVFDISFILLTLNCSGCIFEIFQSIDFSSRMRMSITRILSTNIRYIGDSPQVCDVGLVLYKLISRLLVVKHWHAH